MRTLIAFPIMGFAAILQTTVLSRITLLQGPADLILLILVSWTLQERVDNAWQWALIAGVIVGWLSALPWWLPVLAYLLAIGASLLLRGRVWQIPILALLTSVITGTLITHAVTSLALQIGESSLDLQQAFYQVTLPSLLLNLLLAIPVYGLISEVARWVYPVEIEA